VCASVSEALGNEGVNRRGVPKKDSKARDEHAYAMAFFGITSLGPPNIFELYRLFCVPLCLTRPPATFFPDPESRYDVCAPQRASHARTQQFPGTFNAGPHFVRTEWSHTMFSSIVCLCGGVATTATNGRQCREGERWSLLHACLGRTPSTAYSFL
jgi:hypothetical protein